MVKEHTVDVMVKNDTLKFVSVNDEGKTRTIFVKGDDMSIVEDILHTHGTSDKSEAIEMDLAMQGFKKTRSKTFLEPTELSATEWASLKKLMLKRMDCSEGKSEQYFDLTAKTV